MAEPLQQADGETAAPAAIMFKKRSRAKGTQKKRPAILDHSSSSDGEDGSLLGPRAKRRHQGANTSTNNNINSTININSGSANANVNGDSKNNNSLLPTAFQAERGGLLVASDEATKRSDWFDKPSKKGPAQASTNVRMTTTMDFAPDVCKDYKKSGFCGFGDNCKYLHDRSDVKQGWELDRDWDKFTKGKKDMGNSVVVGAGRNGTDGGGGGGEADEDEAMLESIPFVCIICNGPYRAPIVTRCGHYFCEPCALKRYRKDPTCKNCGAGTGGVFNTASKLDKLLKRRRERATEREEEETAVSEEEEKD